MKRSVGLAVLTFIGVAVWQIGSRLSSDAIGMGVGVLFGIMAGIPTALLVMASGRRRDNDREFQQGGRGSRRQLLPYGAYPQQPPVIVLAGGAMPQSYGQPMGNAYGPGQQQLPMLTAGGQTLEAREFRVIGEKEEWVEDWA